MFNRRFARLSWLMVAPGLAICLLIGSTAPGFTQDKRVAAAAGSIKLVAFGDSLTAGYQLSPADAFPVRLQKALAARGHAVTVTNAGVSGDTTGAALGRIDWAVPPGTEGVILELGANDALRGLPPAQAKANLEKIIETLQSRGIEVLLAGMRAPPNMGEAYTQPFDAIFPALAVKYDLPLYPFFLDGVAADRALNLADGMHPNPAGINVIVDNIMPKMEDLIRRIKQRRLATSRG